MSGAPSGPAPAPTASRLDRALQWTLRPLIVAGVAGLFAESFYQSWATLAKAAKDAEIAHPGTWPWQVDGFMLVMALVIVEAIRAHGGGWWGPRGVWWARLGLVGSTALSTFVQGVYAENPDWWMHALNAPAALFSFEVLIWLLYGATVRPQREAIQEPAGHERPPAPPADRRDGPPDEVAGRGAAAGNQPSRLGSGPAPADARPAPVAVGGRAGTTAGADPGGTEDGNLPDRPATWKGRDETVTAPRKRIAGFAPDDYAALRRQRDHPDRYRAVIAARDLDADLALALAARKGWPAANGDREEARRP